MALKISPLGKGGLLIALMLIAFLIYRFYPVSTTTKTAYLKEFESGYTFCEDTRFKIKDIRIGENSVKELFQDKDWQKEPSWSEYYFSPGKPITLRINDQIDLEKLHMELVTHPGQPLKVFLQDDRDALWKKIPGFGSEALNNKVVELIIKMPCEELTHIIFESMESIIRERIEKATDKRIDLNELFEMLLRETIRPYIESLKEMKDDPCFKTFQLLKWIEGEDVPGFAFGKYYLKEGLKELLDHVVNALKKEREKSGWDRYNLKVKVIGYTDEAPVKNEIDILANQSGIQDWSKIKNALQIYYGACTGDTLHGNSSVYIDYPIGKGKHIKKIKNNCELGAVRAYIAMVYLINELNWSDVEYSYATGGISASPNGENKKDDSNEKDKKGDSQKRRINIEFTVNAAKADK